MKNKFIISVLLVILISLIINCSFFKTPTDTVNELLDACYELDKEKIKELVTNTGYLEPTMKQIILNGNVEKIVESTTTNESLVAVYFSSGKRFGFELKKIDGKWKIINFHDFFNLKEFEW